MRSRSIIASVGLLAGVFVTPSRAAADTPEYFTTKTDADMLLGKWCGTLGNYVFTPKQLRVERHSDGAKYNEDIDTMNFGTGWVEVIFNLHGRERSKSNTVFYEFTKDGTTMSQKANDGGDNGPKMKFRRC